MRVAAEGAQQGAADVSAALPITTIEPPRRGLALNLGELREYRELLYFFVWRDIKVRYKRTVIGAAWAILQPFLTMVVFSLFFGKLAKIPSDGAPYPIFAYAGLVPWTYFATALQGSTNAVIEQARILTKVYFPRILLPAAPVVGGLVDMAISSLLLVAMMVFYGVEPSWRLLTLPPFVVLAALCALAVGLWLAALNALYQDVRYAVPFLVQFWMFASPVAYPSSLAPEQWRVLYGLNPMAGVIEGFRWALLGAGEPPGAMLAVSLAAVALLLAGGLIYFRRVESVFADVV